MSPGHHEITTTRRHSGRPSWKHNERTNDMNIRVHGASLLVIGLTQLALADQPIFNEMPRWKNGWGIQAIYEHRQEDDLLLKDKKIGRGLEEQVDILHIEGVYTWDKSIRMTLKIPYVIEAKRELPTEDGGIETQKDSGLGDITLALPLKKYFNLSARSGSWTLAPQLRVPTSNDDAYEIYDNEWGFGLGVGYETETADLLFSIGAGIWTYLNEEPVEGSANLDLAKNFILGNFSGHLKWENDLKWEDDGEGSLTYLTGPALYLRVTDLVHMRFSYKHDVYDRQGSRDHGKGSATTAGIACVF